MRRGGAIRRRTDMNLQALGYVGIRTRKLEDWHAYAGRFLGLQLTDQSRTTLAFRMDDRKQRVVMEQGETDAPAFYGWEVENARPLDALATHLENKRVQFAPAARALADERRVKDLIVLSDPM